MKPFVATVALLLALAGPASADFGPQDFVQAHRWLNVAAAGGRDAGAMVPKQTAATAPMQVAATAPTGSALIAEVQRMLADLGYDPGPADGKMAWKTRSAIRSYQSRAGLTVDGEPSQGLREHLRGALASRKASAPKTATKQPAPSETGGGAVAGRQTNEIVTRLKGIVDKGERKGLADPAFLAELRRLIRRYDRPRKRRLLSDDFSDGDFTRKPKWSVASGRFTVSRRHHLTSIVKSDQGGQTRQGKVKAEDMAAAVLSQILGAKSSKQTSDASPDAGERAEIFLPRRIDNAFAMTVKISLRPHSICELGVYKGAARQTGYRLVIVADDPLSLYRQGERGSDLIQSSRRALGAGDDAVHKVVWTRRQNGEMVVKFDGKILLKTKDQAFTGAFHGIYHSNRVGECRLRSISVDGAS